MARVVGWHRIRNIATDLSNVLDLPMTQAMRLAVMESQGEEQKAKNALLTYFERRLNDLEASGVTDPAVYAELENAYLYHDSLISGAARLQPSELRLLAEVVPPDTDSNKVAWPHFVSKHFRDILRVDEGTEANVVAGRGKGKTHLMVLAGQEWLAMNPGNIVVHNIPNLQVDDSEAASRWHEFAYTSEIVRLWLDHFGKNILLLLDEPAQTLMSQPGNSKEIDSWNRVRPMLRKMRILTLYAWQFEGQIFKQLREDPVVVRINKPSKDKAVLEWVDDEGEHKLNIEAIPPLVGVRYDTYSLTTVFADLIFPNLVRAVRQAGAKSHEEILAVLRQAIQDKNNYDPEYWIDHGFIDAAGAPEEAMPEADVDRIRRNHPAYLNSWGLLDPNLIREALDCTHREADLIAKKLNKELGLARKPARPKP